MTSGAPDCPPALLLSLPVDIFLLAGGLICQSLAGDSVPSLGELPACVVDDALDFPESPESGILKKRVCDSSVTKNKNVNKSVEKGGRKHSKS